MDAWQRNTRMIHQIGEFLDLDSPKPNLVEEFISLIQAMREGLGQIDDEFQIPDTQINMLFLSKLQARPEWKDWATLMLRDARVSNFSPTEGMMTFEELADLAIKQEKALQRQQTSEAPYAPKPFPSIKPTKPEPTTTPRALTQEEINTFVLQKMTDEGKFRLNGSRRHGKKPSQEEINEYVVNQMRKEQERKEEARKTRNRSQSQPESRQQPSHQRHQRLKSTQAHCTICGASYHPSGACWRRWKVTAAEVPPANFAPKRIEYRMEKPGHPPMYRTGFALT